MDTVKLKINNIEVEAPKTATILEAARLVGIEIPTLCYMRNINAIGACRICVVEVKGARSLIAACVYPVSEGMEVFTNTGAVIRARKNTLELILSNHRMDCLTCLRNQNCELQKLASDFGIQEVRFHTDNMHPQIEDSSLHLVRDNSKCILCRRCVAVCKNSQSVAVIGPNDRGFETHISCAFDRNLDETACVSCGQCITVCPTGALTEKDDTEHVWAALADPKKHVVVGVAPSIRVTLGEAFKMHIGSNVQGKMVAALRRIGFDGVFDVDVTADLTIMEEGAEFLKRLESGHDLPLITSCSPGWIRFCEQYYPEFIPNLSTCKSPQQMFGAMMKTYYAKKMNLDPADIFTVGIMPCTAKKFEIRREDQQAVPGLYDIDVALTTRELARMISRTGMYFPHLPDEEFDPAFGISTGAGVIFGASGGVMEAALRTVTELVTGQPLSSLDFMEVRGMEGIKAASFVLNGRTVRAAVASGLSNCRRLLDRIKSGEASYDIVEMMACPGGCINGGGQPIQPAVVRNFVSLRERRAATIYEQDKHMPLRKSHENPLVKRLYDEVMDGKPGSHNAHKWLHTTYRARPKYPTSTNG
ncbi:MAG: [FeFe] hydrogenase, group A [Oscillospiraceae bacterium]|jgi:NADP-reducing hydrogenase subunit HndD|nr:[FeFe] hydrogenase, group A [Oscillospiraceae bacterium]